LDTRGRGGYGFRDAVGGKDDREAVGNLVEVGDEDGAFRLQAVDDELVVDDLVAHVDRRAVALQRQLDDADRPVDAGAEAARGGDAEGEGRLRNGHGGRWAAFTGNGGSGPWR
jgi:hypothetical protein